MDDTPIYQPPQQLNERMKRIYHLTTMEERGHEAYWGLNPTAVPDNVAVLAELLPATALEQVDPDPLTGNANHIVLSIYMLIAAGGSWEKATRMANEVRAANGEATDWVPHEIAGKASATIMANYAKLRDSYRDTCYRINMANERQLAAKKDKPDEVFSWAPADVEPMVNLSKVLGTARDGLKKFGGTSSTEYRDFKKKWGKYDPLHSFSPAKTPHGSASEKDDILFDALAKFAPAGNWIAHHTTALLETEGGVEALQDPNSTATAFMETLTVFTAAWDGLEHARKLAATAQAKSLNNPESAPRPTMFTAEEMKAMEKVKKDNRTMRGRGWSFGGGRRGGARSNNTSNNYSNYNNSGGNYNNSNSNNNNSGGRGNGNNNNNSYNNYGGRGNSNNSSRGGRSGGRRGGTRGGRTQGRTE
jgi:hypothetical protein